MDRYNFKIVEEKWQKFWQDNNTFKTQQITIISIDTDEGVLDPLGVGEILIEVRY